MFRFDSVTFLDILRVPSLTIESGRITSLLGASGSGKTTLLRMLNKMVSPTLGEIFYKDRPLREIDSVLHRREVLMLSQTPVMFEGSVRDNLLAGLRFRKEVYPEDAVLSAMLERVRLDKPLSEPVEKLSGGEKQRLALGRVLLLDAPVYLMDEPSSSLDEDTATAVIDRITACVREKNKTLVLVTHSGAVANKYSDDIVEIRNKVAERRGV
ncbi:MAG: ATP-binding cassette domain-containing protein [Clostridiaceae bacterium]|nr:ATP-binding cassette domain-containing protein [Clostridiaceae bacterium]